MDAPVAEPVVYRPSLALRAAMVALAAVGFAGAVAALVAGATQGGLGEAIVIAALVSVAAVLFLRFALRSRIELRPDELQVHSLASTHRAPWGDIVGAEPGYSGIAVFLRDGSVINGGAVQKSNASRWLGRTDTRADRVAEEIVRRAGSQRG